MWIWLNWVSFIFCIILGWLILKDWIDFGNKLALKVAIVEFALAFTNVPFIVLDIAGYM